MHRIKTIIRTTLLLACLAVPATADEAPQIVVTIAPVHSLVAGVTEGVTEPVLIMQGAASPHAFAMKPSQAKALDEADVIVRVAENLETSLDKPIEALGKSATVVTLDEIPGMTLLPMREGGVWEAHDHASHGDGHDDHGHGKKAEAGHDDHGHGKDSHAHDDHGHGKKAEAGHDDHGHGHDDHGHGKKAEADHDGHDHKKAGHSHDDHDHDKKAEAGHDGHGHDHGAHNPHIWLDPRNAIVAVNHISEVLAKADPANAQTYEANAKKMAEKLAALDTELEEQTKVLQDQPYLVFHDAYQNFEDRYGLKPVGAITVSPDRQPGAKRIGEIRAKVRDLGAVCVFAEPQFEPKLIGTIVEGTQSRSGVLDPLGANLEPGSELYFVLLRNMVVALGDCLKVS